MQTDKNNPRYVYAQMKRRERYEKERDEEHGLSYYGSDSDYPFTRVSYDEWQRNEQQKKSCLSLYAALEDLKKIDPSGHSLIVEYYLSNSSPKPSMTKIAKKHGISQQACSKKIRKCLGLLKKLVELHR